MLQPRQSLYPRILGAAFDALPPQVRALHSLPHEMTWSGRADVERGPSFVCRLIAALFRLPPTGLDQPLTVTFTPDASGGETWRRTFAGGTFVSHQRAVDRHIEERVGPARLALVPTATAAGLTLRLAGVDVFGLPLLRLLVPHIETREFEADGRYRFEVAATLPLFGPLVRYSGWLEPDART